MEKVISLDLEDELLEALDKFVVKQGRPLTREQAVRMILVDALISCAARCAAARESEGCALVFMRRTKIVPMIHPANVGTIHRVGGSKLVTAGWQPVGNQNFAPVLK
jgi:hypothetical protein